MVLLKISNQRFWKRCRSNSNNRHAWPRVWAADGGGGRPEPDWTGSKRRRSEHFQELVRFDTSDPPGGEAPAVDYLKRVLEQEGIPVEVFALEANRPNLVARLKGTGKKRPLLIMGHTDVGQRRSQEVDAPAVRRRPRRRLHLRPRHGRRQGQRRRGADGDAAAEAAERAARPRRDLPRRSRRGRHDPRRHPVHDRQHFPRSTRSIASPKAAASRRAGAR